MAETIDVPKVGKVNKKWLYAGIAVTAGIVGFAWYRRSRVGATASADIPMATDDSLAGLATNAGSTGSGGYTNPNPVSTVDTTGGTAAYTNTQWAADVTDKLGELGYEPGFVAAVLGKYLNSRPVTSDEAQLIQVAWAYKGKPPQGPPSFTLAGSGSTPGSGGHLTAPAHLTVADTTETSVALSWASVTGAAGYEVYRDGSNVGSPSSPGWNSVGLAPNTSHTYKVRAIAGATRGPFSASVTARTRPTAPHAPTPPAKKTTPGKAPKATYTRVTVTEFHTNNPAWNSTLSGIGAHYHQPWEPIWADPKNARVRTKRGTPEHIQSGDVIYVRTN